jgi:hypothetical protein
VKEEGRIVQVLICFIYKNIGVEKAEIEENTSSELLKN